MGIPLEHATVERFLEYGILLQKWGTRMNLTSRLGPLEIISRHFLDSLALLVSRPPEPEANVADLGSGAGFPGIPLKLVRPDLRMTLVESHSRKASFLAAAIAQLGLQGVSIDRGRVGARPPEGTHDLVVARAVAPFPTLLPLAEGLLRRGGVLAAWKGPEEEPSQKSSPEWRYDTKEIVSIPGRPEPRAIFFFTFL